MLFLERSTISHLPPIQGRSAPGRELQTRRRTFLFDRQASGRKPREFNGGWQNQRVGGTAICFADAGRRLSTRKSPSLVEGEKAYKEDGKFRKRYPEGTVDIVQVRFEESGERRLRLDVQLYCSTLAVHNALPRKSNFPEFADARAMIAAAAFTILYCGLRISAVPYSICRSRAKQPTSRRVILQCTVPYILTPLYSHCTIRSHRGALACLIERFPILYCIVHSSCLPSDRQDDHSCDANVESRR